MSFFRWLSVGLAVSSGLLIAGWTLLLLGPAWTGAGGGYATPVLGAAVLALVIGLGHRLAIGVHEAQLHKLTMHIESLGREDGAPSEQPPAGRFGVGEVAAAVHKRFTPMCRRAEELARERRDLEVRLRMAEAQRRQLEAILNAITDAVVVTDAFDEVALANEAAARLLSFDLRGAPRRPLEQLVGDDALVNLIKETRAGGRHALGRHVEHRIGHNGQSGVYDVTLVGVPAGSVEGEQAAAARASSPEAAVGGEAPAGVVTILRDVTREKEIQEMKSHFVSNVSHELRTPLSSIKAYMEMLIDGEAQDEQTCTEFYHIIQGETNRLSRLIDNILNINRIESGIVKVQRENVPLGPLVCEAVDIMLPQARAKRIELSFMPPPVSSCIHADRDMILQSLLNCLSNAIKYTPEGGRVLVELGVDEEARMATVAVTDTGAGIPEADLPHLFEKFYRVSDHKKLAKGTGLGLNLVKHVIETVHDGRVSVQSRVNQGSTFTFALPIAEKVQGCP